MNEPGFTIAIIMLELIFSAMLIKILIKAGLSKLIMFIISAVLFIWLLLIYSLLSKGFFSATGIPQLSFTIAVILPVALGYLAIRKNHNLREAVNAMSTNHFLYLQCWRAIFGVMFFFTSALPMWFKYLGGIGDIAAGIGAFLALQAFGKGAINERQAIVRGNLVGIFDFIIVLNFGAGVVLQNQSPDIPFNLIPLYVVPLFILLHVFSLQRWVKLKKQMG